MASPLSEVNDGEKLVTIIGLNKFLAKEEFPDLSMDRNWLLPILEQDDMGEVDARNLSCYSKFAGTKCGDSCIPF